MQCYVKVALIQRQHFQDYFSKNSMFKDWGTCHFACGVEKGRWVGHSGERNGTFLIWASVPSTGESAASLCRMCTLYKSMLDFKFFKFLVLLLSPRCLLNPDRKMKKNQVSIFYPC